MESRVRLFRYAFAAAAWLFMVCLVLQVFLAGLSLLGGQPSWPTHRGLGHSLGGLVLLMVVLAYAGRLPFPMKRFMWLTLALYLLLADVVLFLRGSVPWVAALHPVLAVLLFGATAFLALRAWGLLRQPVKSVIASHPVLETTQAIEGR